MLSTSITSSSTDWPINRDKYETQIGSEPLEFDHDEVILESRLELDDKKIEAYLTRTKLYWCATYASTKTRKQSKDYYFPIVLEVYLY